MRVFGDDVSREQVIWLLLHGLAAIGLGALVAFVGAQALCAPRPEQTVLFAVALAGGATMVLSGSAVMAVAGKRLLGEFAVKRMQFGLDRVIVLEALAVVLCGALVLDGGVLAFKLVFAFLALNFGLLGCKLR